MRRRVERALLLSALVVGAGWALRTPLQAVRWSIEGVWELIRLPSFPAPAPIPAPTRVAHAGGSFQGKHYTNAPGALEENYARGARWFEMDFLVDADGGWWAVHDWGEAHDQLGVPLDGRGLGLPQAQPSSAPFRLLRLEETLAWFTAHRDARLITDTKGDNAALLHRLESAPPGLRSRIHPQIYRLSEYALARPGGFGAPIFTTYRTPYPWWVLGRFVHRAAVLAVTVTRGEARDACAALCGQVPLLAHTINDPSEAAELMRAGIAGIYTDDLLP
jgi:glycerophosphoryl diester phosphodiesterase